MLKILGRFYEKQYNRELIKDLGDILDRKVNSLLILRKPPALEIKYSGF